MHRLLILPALLLVTACTGGNASRPGDTAAASRGPACFEPRDVRTWHNARGEVIYVDTGRRKYRVDLLGNCLELGNSSRMGFRGDTVTGRVCGNYGDLVILPHATCRISRVSLVDDETYARATGTGKEMDEDPGED